MVSQYERKKKSSNQQSTISADSELTMIDFFRISQNSHL